MKWRLENVMEPSDQHPPATLRLSREQSKQQTRRRLLDAAMRQMTNVGYQRATLDRIAADAGCTKGALYWHFPNKQTLFLALIEQSIAENIAHLAGLVELNSDPRRLKTELGRWLDAVDEGLVLPALGVEMEIEARHDPSFQALHRAMTVRHEAAMTDFLHLYFRTIGETAPLPLPALATTIITIYKGFALCRREGQAGGPRSAQVARLLLRMPLRDGFG